MKRLFALVLSFCMALSIGVCAAAAETPLRENENGVLLSSLDYEECRSFLLNQGVSIPEELSGIDLPKLFADLESNPDNVVHHHRIIFLAVGSFHAVNSSSFLFLTNRKLCVHQFSRLDTGGLFF